MHFRRRSAPRYDVGNDIGGLTLYKVIINLPGGKRLEAVEASFLRAVNLVESYHSVLTGYTITQIEEGEDNSGGKVDQDSN